MAVGFDAKPTAYNSADGLNQQAAGATSISAASGMTIGGTANLLVGQLAFGATTSTAPTNVAMTWNSVSMTKENQSDSSGGGDNATAVSLSLAQPTTGSNTLAASWTGALDVYMSCASFTGAAIETTGTTSNTQSVSLAINSTTDGATVACFSSNGSTTTPTQTKIWMEAPLSPGGGGSYAIAGSPTVTHTFTGGSGSRQAMSGVQLKAGGQTEVNATPGTWTWTGSTSTVVRDPGTAFQQNAFQSNAFQIFGGSTGAAPTTINAAPGTWSWAGANSPLAVQQISAAIGTWSWAGTTATIPTMIAATPGTWSWAGSNSPLAAQQVNQTIGTWSWAGSNSPPAVQQINQVIGTWTWAGSTATIDIQQINQTQGTWTWAGTTQTITTPGGATEINAVPGTWTWAGAQATLEVPQINQTTGTFSWAGTTQTFNQLINATPGTWTWVGTIQGIVQTISIDATPGLWSWSGTRATIVNEPEVTGGWPIYYPRRKKKREPVPEQTPEQIQADIGLAQIRLEQRRELRRTERKSRYLTEQIRSILDEQDRMRLSIEALKLELVQKGLNDDDIALILALAS